MIFRFFRFSHLGRDWAVSCYRVGLNVFFHAITYTQLSTSPKACLINKKNFKTANRNSVVTNDSISSTAKVELSIIV